MQAAASGLSWIDPHSEPAGRTANSFSAPAPHLPALLQYTSGSTGDPRGVIVTHANLLHNSALISQAGGNSPDQTTVGWLPLFHDMGLVGLVLQAAFAGSRCVFMSPERFLMRPWLWLKMISDYRAGTSPAPNFAYDLCVEKVSADQKAALDLSRWRNAFNGSEPVRPATMDRFAATFASSGFRREAFFPCYGLAEATLFVTGPGNDPRLRRRSATGELLSADDENGHVSCGRTFGDTLIAIVDPATRRKVVDGSVGEIWVAGPSCAAGYWNNPGASAATFNARIHSSDNDIAQLSWLRTGDLGFIADGELFITGRLRELIIIYGRNYFPVHIERTAEAADDAIATSACVAFSIDPGSVEKLIVLAEVRRDVERAARSGAGEIDSDAICKRVRAAVVADHEVAPRRSPAHPPRRITPDHQRKAQPPRRAKRTSIKRYTFGKASCMSMLMSESRISPAAPSATDIREWILASCRMP